MRRLALFIGLVLGLIPVCSHGQHEVRLESCECSSAHFANHDLQLSFIVTSSRKLAGRFTWSYSAKERTLARGEVAITSDGSAPEKVTVKLKTPPVKEGVVFETKLLATLEEAGQRKPVASLEKSLWLFPARPFADRTTWLKELHIVLFDPIGTTSQVFDRHEIPYQSTSNIAAVEQMREGVLIVGEGASLADYPILFTMLTSAAARGVSVVCLAPSDGTFSWPGSVEGQPQARSLTFRRQEVITKLDGRLDGELLLQRNSAIASGLLVGEQGGQVVCEISRSDLAWPWLEIGYDRARLILCGFPVIQRWDDGPTPRFLFARLLEYVTEQQRAQAGNSFIKE